MSVSDGIGYLASLLVLLTFCMQGMVSLRAVAIASNVAFIAYAAVAGIGPVMVLHVLLLPMNVVRLSQAVAARRRERHGLRPLAAVDGPGTASMPVTVEAGCRNE